MANTNQLKYIIEPELKRNFCDKYGCELIALSNKELQHIFNDMEPDLVAIDKNSGTLHIGEITTSDLWDIKTKIIISEQAKRFLKHSQNSIYSSWTKVWLYRD